MKLIKYIAVVFGGLAVLASCKKEEVPKGVDELAHHYYAVFVPNNNTAVTVTRNQTTLVKFPVQFYSTFVRDYDAVCKYAVTVYGQTAPAVRGVDYNVVDKNGNVLASADTTYNMVFPKAVQAMDTIYLKMLNNTATGVRKFEVQILDNITPQYEVDNFSTAYRRPVQIN